MIISSHVPLFRVITILRLTAATALSADKTSRPYSQGQLQPPASNWVQMGSVLGSEGMVSLPSTCSPRQEPGRQPSLASITTIRLLSLATSHTNNPPNLLDINLDNRPLSSANQLKHS